MARREIGRRRDLATDVLDVIARPGVSVGELTSVGKAAHEAALPREAAAVTAVAGLAERESVTRVRLETLDAEARELKRVIKEAEAQAQREAVKLRDVERRRAQAEEEAVSLRQRLQTEEATRRKVEAASVQTLQELRQLEEARREACHRT